VLNTGDFVLSTRIAVLSTKSDGGAMNADPGAIKRDPDLLNVHPDSLNVHPGAIKYFHICIIFHQKPTAALPVGVPTCGIIGKERKPVRTECHGFGTQAVF